MEILLIAAGVAILVALVVLVMKNRWKTIATARGSQAEELERKAAFLRSHDVKCRVKIDQGAGPAAGISAGLGDLPHTAVVKLEVKPKASDRARQLLEQLDREARQELTLSL